MDPVNVAGKLNSLNHDGCLATIGPVIASMTRATLQAMLDAVQEIDRRLGIPGAIVSPLVEPGSGWNAIGYNKERVCYTLNLRGVCWEVSRAELEAFIRDGGLPFLARGTTSNLLASWE